MTVIRSRQYFKWIGRELSLPEYEVLSNLSTGPAVQHKLENLSSLSHHAFLEMIKRLERSMIICLIRRRKKSHRPYAWRKREAKRSSKGDYELTPVGSVLLLQKDPDIYLPLIKLNYGHFSPVLEKKKYFKNHGFEEVFNDLFRKWVPDFLVEFMSFKSRNDPHPLQMVRSWKWFEELIIQRFLCVTTFAAGRQLPTALGGRQETWLKLIWADQELGEIARQGLQSQMDQSDYAIRNTGRVVDFLQRSLDGELPGNFENRAPRLEM